MGYIPEIVLLSHMQGYILMKKLFLFMIKLEFYPNYLEKDYLIDTSNICAIDRDCYGNFKLQNLNLVIEKLSELGINRKNIIAIADASLRYRIDSVRDYNCKIKQKLIIESPAAIAADEAILAYCLKNENSLFISNDLMKKYLIYLPKNWLAKHRITVMKIKAEIYFLPMIQSYLQL